MQSLIVLFIVTLIATAPANPLPCGTTTTDCCTPAPSCADCSCSLTPAPDPGPVSLPAVPVSMPEGCAVIAAEPLCWLPVAPARRRVEHPAHCHAPPLFVTTHAWLI